MKRLEDECRKVLSLAYTMVTKHGWSYFKAYAYANDLLDGMSMSLMALGLYTELNLVRYYKNITSHWMIVKAQKEITQGG